MSYFTHIKCQLLATQQPHSRDRQLVILSEGEHRGKGILVQLFKSLECASDEIGSHEIHLERTVVVVVGAPQAPAFLVKVLPEEWKSFRLYVFVAVDTLKLVEVKRAEWGRGRETGVEGRDQVTWKEELRERETIYTAHVHAYVRHSLEHGIKTAVSCKVNHMSCL